MSACSSSRASKSAAGNEATPTFQFHSKQQFPRLLKNQQNIYVLFYRKQLINGNGLIHNISNPETTDGPSPAGEQIRTVQVKALKKNQSRNTKGAHDPQDSNGQGAVEVVYYPERKGLGDDAVDKRINFDEMNHLDVASSQQVSKVHPIISMQLGSYQAHADTRVGKIDKSIHQTSDDVDLLSHGLGNLDITASAPSTLKARKPLVFSFKLKESTNVRNKSSQSAEPQPSDAPHELESPDKTRSKKSKKKAKANNVIPIPASDGIFTHEGDVHDLLLRKPIDFLDISLLKIDVMDGIPESPPQINMITSAFCKQLKGDYLVVCA